MITLFACPRPFRAPFDGIQKNAIGSWLALDGVDRVILLGDDEGTEEVARELGVTHVPDVERNEHGTPLVDDLFAKAAERSASPVLAYVNADIILLDDFVAAVRRVAAVEEEYLVVGQRWDLQVDDRLDFEAPGWQDDLRDRVARRGSLHAPSGIDFFVYPRGFWGPIPPFALGRMRWDNWLLYEARASGAPLIDATPVITAIHQNHEYPGSPDGGRAGVVESPEARRNLELAGGWDHCFTIRDATHVLGPSGARPTLDRWHLRRHFETLPVLRPWLRRPVGVVADVLEASRPWRERLGWTLPTSDEQHFHWTHRKRI